MPYSEAFKAQMVKKMVAPNGWSATALSEEVGVPQSTLSRWLRDVRRLPDVTKPKDEKRSPKKWTPEEKLRVVTEAGRLSDDELGAFLRREGVREEQLAQWREAIEEALRGGTKRKKGTAEGKRLKDVVRDAPSLDISRAKARELIRKRWGDDGKPADGSDRYRNGWCRDGATYFKFPSPENPQGNDSYFGANEVIETTRLGLVSR